MTPAAIKSANSFLFLICTFEDVYKTWHPNPRRHQVFQKFSKKSLKSLGPCLHALSPLENFPLPTLVKTPPETESLPFLIRDELWKQREPSELCNCLHPLRGKSRAEQSCRSEPAMTGQHAGGVLSMHYEWCWVRLSWWSWVEVMEADEIVPTYWSPVGNALWFYPKNISLIHSPPLTAHIFQHLVWPQNAHKVQNLLFFLE